MSQGLFADLYRSARGGKGIKRLKKAAKVMDRRNRRRDGKVALRKES